MRIGILGTGGVGGYFGARWSQAGMDVAFIARGEHLAVLRSNGLTVRSPEGDVHLKIRAASDPQEIGPVDLVVVATKTWQLEDVLPQLTPLLGPETMVMGLQNGVEAASQLARAVGSQRVLGGTCRIISYIECPGFIRHAGVHPTLSFGESAGGPSERTQRLHERLARARGMTVSLSESIEVEIWRKFLFFAPLSGIGSVVQAPIGILRRVPEVRESLLLAMREVLTLASARGVTLGEADFQNTVDFLDGLPDAGTTSMQRDFRDGRRTELEALSGAVARLSREAGLSAPTHSFVYAFLLPQELRARGALQWD